MSHKCDILRIKLCESVGVSVFIRKRTKAYVLYAAHQMIMLIMLIIKIIAKITDI